MVSDPSATTTQTPFEHLLVGDVSRIEVLKGSQSGLYGGDAVAGVIGIERKRRRNRLLRSGGGEYGAYNTFRGAIRQAIGGRRQQHLVHHSRASARTAFRRRPWAPRTTATTT